MLSHVHVGVRDFPTALTFYGAILEALGWRRRFVDEGRPWAGWEPEGQARPLFLIGAPFDGQPAAPGNGQMVALLAPDRARVDLFHAAALANGGTCDGPPGLRPHYHPNYYGAYVRDAEGNKLCACCHDPA